MACEHISIFGIANLLPLIFGMRSTHHHIFDHHTANCKALDFVGCCVYALHLRILFFASFFFGFFSLLFVDFPTIDLKNKIHCYCRARTIRSTSLTYTCLFARCWYVPVCVCYGT